MMNFGKWKWTKQALGVLLLGGCLLVSLPVLVQAAPPAQPPAVVELTLEDSIRMALDTNPSLKLAESQKESAQALLIGDQMSRLPSITGVHTDLRSRLRNTAEVLQPITERFDNVVRASMPIFTAGRISANIEQSRAQYHSADWGVAKTRQQLRLDATNAYYGVLALKNLVALNEESVDQLEQHLKNVQLQFEVGTVAKVDVLRSAVQVANEKQALIIAQNQYDVGKATLNNIIGLPLSTVVKLKEELAYAKYDQTLEGVMDYAMIHRPEIIQAQDGVKAARAGIAIARSGFYPTVTVNGSLDWNDRFYPGIENRNWSASVISSWNIFDAGVTQTNLRLADQTLISARETLIQTIDSVRLEVQASYLGLREAEKRIETNAVAVEQGEEDYKIAQIRYQAGVGTNLDVIDAQVALTQAKTNSLQALYDYNKSRSDLERSIGVKI